MNPISCKEPIRERRNHPSANYDHKESRSYGLPSFPTQWHCTRTKVLVNCGHIAPLRDEAGQFRNQQSRTHNNVGSSTRVDCALRPYSAIMRSAHSTRETKVAGLPNFALQLARSFSETPRAREQAPQENTGMCLATIFSRNSLSGGQPMGIIASDVAFRIR